MTPSDHPVSSEDAREEAMTLYDLNDELSALAQRAGITRESFVGDYDEWLDSLTHSVAKELGVYA
jgi:hypothetical protein